MFTSLPLLLMVVDDAEHIAAETVAGLSVAASWSLRHMVNLWRIQCYNEVNRQMGHTPSRPQPKGA